MDLLRAAALSQLCVFECFGGKLLRGSETDWDEPNAASVPQTT
jgi:hypothetical protein